MNNELNTLGIAGIGALVGLAAIGTWYCVDKTIKFVKYAKNYCEIKDLKKRELISEIVYEVIDNIAKKND